MMRKQFGKMPDGRDVYLYTIENDNLSLSVLDYGARIQKLVFDHTDVVCGFDTMEDYIENGDYHGAIVGRYANRINGASFTLNGRRYQLSPNDPWGNQLHGGTGGFSFSLWKAEIVPGSEGPSIVMTLDSPDGDQGYPGNLSVKVTYQLCSSDLIIRYEAVCDADTYLNMTNHSYFNISGYASGSVLSHELLVDADFVTEFLPNRIPTGKRKDVNGTPFDFRTPHLIGERMDDSDPLLRITSGYAHNFWMNSKAFTDYAGRRMSRHCVYSCAERSMTIYSEMPCMQIYAGQSLATAVPMKSGVAQTRCEGIALESQYEPDSCNHGRYILKAGEKYDKATVYRFDKFSHG